MLLMLGLKVQFLRCHLEGQIPQIGRISPCGIRRSAAVGSAVNLIRVPASAGTVSASTRWLRRHLRDDGAGSWRNEMFRELRFLRGVDKLLTTQLQLAFPDQRECSSKLQMNAPHGCIVSCVG